MNSVASHNHPKHIYTGVLGLAVNSQRQFLITQRNQPEHPDVHGKWQVPGGGVEYGEQPEETLIRELQEELKVTPRVLYHYPICRTQVWQHHKFGSSVVLMCYVISIESQVPCIGDPETLDFRWVTMDELDTLSCLPLTHDFVAEAQQICTAQNLWP